MQSPCGVLDAASGSASCGRAVRSQVPIFIAHKLAPAAQPLLVALSTAIDLADMMIDLATRLAIYDARHRLQPPGQAAT